MLTSLRGLFVEENVLQGTIPATIGTLRSLEAIDLSTNDFTGSLPAELGLLTSLIEFDMVTTKISGTIPTQIGNLGNLKIWICVENRMWGQIPSEIGMCSDLEMFHIASPRAEMMFSGTIPIEMFQLSRLKLLEINQSRSGKTKRLGNFGHLAESLYVSSKPANAVKTCAPTLTFCFALCFQWHPSV